MKCPDCQDTKNQTPLGPAVGQPSQSSYRCAPCGRLYVAPTDHACPACGSDGHQHEIGELWDLQQQIHQCAACDRFYLRDAAAANVPDLSERDRQILSLAACGKSDKVIASEMKISVRTVNHRHSAMLKKIGVSSTAELVRWAVERGLLPNQPHH